MLNAVSRPWGRIFFVCLLIFGGLAPLRTADRDSGGADPDQRSNFYGNPILAREKWFLRSRRGAHGETPATLRQRALQQKAEVLRAQLFAHGMQARPGVAVLSQGSGPLWQPLGPSPLISSPSGQQNYGNVSGRVTAIAVDQADNTG